ncbi:hypothetical protein GSI_06985 [Ganoderma sinense ZZ0214-1]|uniref:GAG-pre-integrase domain-containing protein n=1 Tax=Ganoderma sinense ZZ0214-1 TaxID=1077348 RepID=A0A2G8SAM9_9APHY|nr:hypothetical protein GSI_06985 [Ganoderma sinense ZZ0214-1]
MHYASVAIVHPDSASALVSAPDRSSSLSSPAATHWNTDTGTSSDMTPHSHWFRSYSPHSIPIRLANSHIIYSEGLGSVVFQPAERGGVLPPAIVLHVPALSSNLLSIFHLTREKGYAVKLCESSVLFYHQGQLRFEAQVNDNNISYLRGHTISQPKSALSASTSCDEDLFLWHQRCGHVNFDDLHSVVRKELVNGLTIRSKHLKGKLLTPTPEGYLYWMVGFWAMAYLKRKSDVFVAFKAYKAYAENCLGLCIKPHGTTRAATQAKLPPLFWGHTVSTFVHTCNRIPTAALDGGIPYTAWKGDGRKPDDCKVLQPHMHKCIFIGYPDGTKAWKFWNPAVKKVIISLHAVFDEQCFPTNLPFINVFGLPLDNVDIPKAQTMLHHLRTVCLMCQSCTIRGEMMTMMILHLLHLQHPCASSSSCTTACASTTYLISRLYHSRLHLQHLHHLHHLLRLHHRPPAPSVHQEAQNCTGFRPYPALARKELPACSSRPQGSLNKRVLECQNLIPQRLRICSASSVPPPLSQSAPHHLIQSLRLQSMHQLLLAFVDDEEALHAMLVGIEDVYSDPSFNYLSYDEALEVSFESVVKQASKANQEHFGEPRSMSEDELQSLVENGTFELVLLPPGRKAIGFWWVFWVKRNADGSIECYKGRLIAKGFFQRPGFEYNEIFAPTPK